MKLRHTLIEAGLVPNGRVVQRMSELQGYLREGTIPSELTRKLHAVPDHHSREGSTLRLAAEALIQHNTGGRRLSEPFASLAAYSLAYLWEDNDEIVDSSSQGLSDDLHVAEQVAHHGKHDLEALMLKSCRTLVQARWKEVRA